MTTVIRHREQNEGLLAAAVIACVLFVSCTTGDSEQPDGIDASVDELRQDVDLLTHEIEALREGPETHSHDELTRGIDSIAGGTGEADEAIDDVKQDLARLSGIVERQQSELDLLSNTVDDLAESSGAAQMLEPTPPSPEGPDKDIPPEFILQLLHASDMDGEAGSLDNVENFSAILDGFRRQFPGATLVLSSGDNFIPGPRFFAASDEANAPVLGVPGQGRGDIALLNAMEFQASALGNHELDLGTGVFASIVRAAIGESGTYPGALFPYLSSNLGFQGDGNLRPLVVSDGQESFLAAGSLAGSAVITVDGERIGVVGATTPELASITASGGITVVPESGTDIESLAAVVQESVDQLIAQGIDKVILLAHLQRLDLEEELAKWLTDVDIIVAGGSKTILADENDRPRPGDQAEGSYPLHFVSPTGDTVLLVNTDGDYRYLGRLVVGFDQDGVVIPEFVDPHISGAYATDPRGGQVFAGHPIPEVTAIVRSLKGVLRDRDSNIVGRTAVYLAGRRWDVRTQETNLGNLTTDANLWLARQVAPDVAVSLKNGGGIRDDIGLVIQPPGTTDPADVEFLPPPANADADKKRGDISQLDIEGSLRFNNGLVIVTLTAPPTGRRDGAHRKFR